MEELKKAINAQKQIPQEMKEKNDFYKIKNPIYGYEHIHIFCRNEHLQTKKSPVNAYRKRGYTYFDNCEQLKYARVDSNHCLCTKYNALPLSYRSL